MPNRHLWLYMPVKFKYHSGHKQYINDKTVNTKYYYFMQNIDWYNGLNKPFLNPPDWIFLPVWTILYIMIIISFVFFIKGKYSRAKLLPLIFFTIQMFLNIIWSGIFFGMENIGAALIVLIFMWIFILLTVITFYKHSKTASILLIPYFIWGSFALYLNFSFYILN